ncbi:MAG: hypothetical protein U0746_21380 [Gemmataceae bacterium]
MARALALALALTVVVPQVLADRPVIGGTIAQVDHEHFRLQVTAGDGREYWFACRPDTVFTLRGYAATFADMLPGYRVVVTYDQVSSEAYRVDALP